MGLIVPTDPPDVTAVITKNYHQVNTLISSNISSISVVRVCTDGSSSSSITDSVSIDKTVYRVLSMQDDMKVLQEPVRVRNEFDLFIEYAEKKTAGNVYDSGFDQLDAHLGTIGVSNEMCQG